MKMLSVFALLLGTSSAFAQICEVDMVSGNFDVNNSNEQMKLRSIIAGKIADASCQRRSAQELRLFQNPYLIEDLAKYQYRNCHVQLNVQGWAHQLYIRGQFAGNFDKNSELPKLKHAIVENIINGTCVFDPIR